MTNLPSHAHCLQELLSYSERSQWIRETDTWYRSNKAWPSNLQCVSLTWTCHDMTYQPTQTRNRFHYYHGDSPTCKFHHSRQLQVLRSTKKRQPKMNHALQDDDMLNEYDLPPIAQMIVNTGHLISWQG